MDRERLKYKSPERNVREEFQQIMELYNPINLATGFPDYPLHMDAIVEKMLKVITTVPQRLQIRNKGYAQHRLGEILTRIYSKLTNGLISGFHHLLVTTGGQQALFSVLSAHIEPGNEVIIFEPAMESYRFLINMFGGVIKTVQMGSDEEYLESSKDWAIRPTDLESCFNDQTKLIILNNPHNPTGKIFSMEELKFIADLCEKWNVICVSDERYEWLVVPPQRLNRIVSIDGMWDRTLTIGSDGKNYCLSSLQIGWIYGFQRLLDPIRVNHYESANYCPKPIQRYFARRFLAEWPNLGKDNSNLKMSFDFRKRRDFLCKVLTEAGFVPTVPDAGFFIVADWSKLESKIDLSGEEDDRKDYKFAKWFIRNIGIACLPMSEFYTDENKHLGANYVRICFVKFDEDFDKIAAALYKLVELTSNV